MKVNDTSLLIQVNGVSVSYLDYGSGDVPVIFIHGFPFDKSTWKPQIDFLKKNTRVIAYDVRGFGKSTFGRETPSIDLFASDLLGLMDALKIKKAIVCGLSMGGYIVLNAMSRHPERFEALIFGDTQCIADSAEQKENRYKTIKQIEQKGLEAFTENFLKAALYKGTFENNNKLVLELKNLILSTSSQTITAALHALAQRRETCTLLKRISLPTLILCGKEDSLTPVAQSEFLLNAIPGSKFKTIEDAGHLSNLEQPDLFNKHIHSFLSDLKA